MPSVREEAAMKSKKRKVVKAWAIKHFDTLYDIHFLKPPQPTNKEYSLVLVEIREVKP